MKANEEPKITLIMNQSSWDQIVDDLENHYRMSLEETEIGQSIKYRKEGEGRYKSIVDEFNRINSEQENEDG